MEWENMKKMHGNGTTGKNGVWKCGAWDDMKGHVT